MIITINGKPQTTDHFTNLDELIRSVAGKDQGFIVQLNNRIIKRDQWRAHTLHESDVIELITLVGGG